MHEQPMLSVRNLEKQFGPGCRMCKNPIGRQLEKNYCPHCRTVYACQNISFDLFPGEILGIVGESGSGKSTLMQCLYFDEELTAGEASINISDLDGENVFTLSNQQKRYIRNHYFGMVYQNPMKGLKMDFSAIGNIAEKLIAAGGRNVAEMEVIGKTLLEKVHIPLFRMKEEPRRFSGGMQQRVQIAKALSNQAPVLFLDEVTTGLDLSVQASVLDLIKKIQRELGISMIVVSHDLAVIRMLADRTLVMLNGAVVEEGLTDQILEDPQSPYTQQLVYSLL
ncbi:ATP-binding cassette domain-containing protein [Cytobacillus purgationiresistens]|uniref:Phosphonate transport system ATP-binding protein n=1 Tax=Cytobacillus purgationiresistens TaxID=863449 RepID=A0ABU0AKP4_9BACI|nr:ATP-binding cassette domain-containing protein [Cytobacillus purgationiresistens]MDQ0271841.1 putative phosphonate transport system ATP-binding protein [Cytobacillus purgationiresistens]